MNEFNKDFETGIAYIYGRPSPYKSKSIYGYLRNNNYTSKQSDVVILVKDNDFKYFCIMIKYYKILWSDMQIYNSMFQANKMSSWSAEIQTTQNATIKAVRCTLKTRKQTKKIKVWYFHFGLSDIWRLLIDHYLEKHNIGQPLRTKSNTVVLNRFW